MKRHSVNSSMAVSVGYDPATSTLEIEFKSGEVWQYHAVPKRVYTELLKDSIGKYFQAHIKGLYPESRIS